LAGGGGSGSAKKLSMRLSDTHSCAILSTVFTKLIAT
jgi:hypothetical protein